VKAVLLGASRGMGRAIARQMSARGDVLFLLGTDERELARSSADLAIGGEPAAGFATCDLADPSSFSAALARAELALGGLDAVLVTAGIFATQDALESDPSLAARLLDIDFTGTIMFCEEARKRLLARGGGTLAVWSSVAGERARKPVVLYGAAKAGLTHYLEGLDHKFRGDGLAVVCVKPGFVKTGMTAGLKPPPFAGEPDEVARRILRAIDRRAPIVYAPFAWRPIMAIIRALPRFVMRRIGF
jgi:NAD(P)-dependent dehydrogenase (short-subunit alcohol dehydrogenase family)